MLRSLLIVATFLMQYGASALSEQPNYQIFNSTVNSNYSVRFVNPQLCDPNVTQYSGYLDMGTNHYFFWFFESKTTPEEKPLTAWLNGGPGCSSMIGLWQENGPCRSDSSGSNILYNPYTWTHASNMLYIDQPNGVGYSYGSSLAHHISEGAEAFYEAMQLFYEAFPKYNKNPFHMFGESYAGRYIPYYANYMVEQNMIRNASTTHIPIESVGLGNGWINPLLQFKSNIKMACIGDYGQLIPASSCKKMETNYEQCARLMKKCHETDNQKSCVEADDYCVYNIDSIFESSNVSFYDVRQSSKTIEPPEEYIQLLNSPKIKSALGVNSKIKFEQCADAPFDAMNRVGEGARDSSSALATLLDYGVRVLNYVGDADYACNWYGVYDVLANLNFAGSDTYNQLKLKPWIVDNRQVGQTKGTDKLTFLRVYDAGHEVPYYQPKNTLIMFDTWLNVNKKTRH